MTYLSNVTNERPMLRISATIILAFTCAAPFVLLISGVVGYGVRSLIHWKQIDRATNRQIPAPGAGRIGWRSKIPKRQLLLNNWFPNKADRYTGRHARDRATVRPKH
jgi:hypothetical protein